MLERQEEAPEENRTQKDQHRELDRLALGSGDHRDREAEPNRREDGQPQRQPVVERCAQRRHAEERGRGGGQRHADERQQETVAERLAQQDVADPDRRDAEQLEGAQQAVAHRGERAEGHPHVLEQERQYGRGVEGDLGRLDRHDVPGVGRKRRDQRFGRDLVDAPGQGVQLLIGGAHFLHAPLLVR